MRFAGDSGGPYSSHASSWTPYWMCVEADAPAGANSTNANTQTTAATRILMSPPIRRTPYAYPPRPRLDARMLGRRKNSVGADPHAHVRGREPSSSSTCSADLGCRLVAGVRRLRDALAARQARQLTLQLVRARHRKYRDDRRQLAIRHGR